MRNKIQFNNEIDNFIRKSFNENVNQAEVRKQLEEKFNFKVGVTRLSDRYKILGLNGNKKTYRDYELTPWYDDMFVNDEFPNQLTNCIINDLIWNNKYVDIASKHHTDTKTLLKYFKPEDLTKEIRSKFNAYLRLYKYKGRTELYNLTKYSKNLIRDRVNDFFQGKIHLIPNFKITICDVEYSFDFYCPEVDRYFIGPAGRLYTNVTSLNTIGYKVTQLREFDVQDNKIVPRLENEEIIPVICDIIMCDLNNIKYKENMRIDPVWSQKEIDLMEDKLKLKIILDNL